RATLMTITGIIMVFSGRGLSLGDAQVGSQEYLMLRMKARPTTGCNACFLQILPFLITVLSSNHSTVVQRSHYEAEALLIANLDVSVALHPLSDGGELPARPTRGRSRTPYAVLCDCSCFLPPEVASESNSSWADPGRIAREFGRIGP